MTLYNTLMMIRMAFDIKALKTLLKSYLFFRHDKSFNIIKMIKVFMFMIKHEKIIKYENKYILNNLLPPVNHKSMFTHFDAVPYDKNKYGKYLQHMYPMKKAPISFYLSLTSKCPNNCEYCSVKYRKSKYPELTTDQWLHVIEDIQDMGTSIIGLTGGEPSLFPGIYDIIKFIDNRSISFLYTSGIDLTYEKAKKLKDCGLYGIGISLDSANPDILNKSVGNKNAYINSVQALKNASSAGLYTTAHAVVADKYISRKYMFELFDLVKQCHAHEVRVFGALPAGKLLDCNNENVFSDKSRKLLIDIQIEANKRFNYPKISMDPYSESYLKFGCNAGIQHSYISECGDLYPCDFVPISFGNVLENNIKQLWEHMFYCVGYPKLKCFCLKHSHDIYNLSKHYNNGDLPIKSSFVQSIFNKYNSHFYLPDFYKKLQ